MPETVEMQPVITIKMPAETAERAEAVLTAEREISSQDPGRQKSPEEQAVTEETPSREAAEMPETVETAQKPRLPEK